MSDSGSEKLIFGFFTYEDGRHKCVIDGVEMPCSTLWQAVALYNKMVEERKEKENDKA